MASIIKRGRSWRAMIVRKGQRVSATFDTKAEAEDWALRSEAAIMSGVQAKAVAPMSATQSVIDLFRRYAAEVSPGKRGTRWEQIRIAAFCRSERFAVPIQLFSAIDMAGWRDDRLLEVAPSTINRDLNLISAIFNHAIKEWRCRFHPIRCMISSGHGTQKHGRAESRRKSGMPLLIIWGGIVPARHPPSGNGWPLRSFWHWKLPCGKVSCSL